MMLTVCIGYDHRESIAYHVLSHSILRRASRPVAIVPLATSLLPTFTRPRSPMQSTDFTYSRFLTPSLAGYGQSIFLDCDMLCLSDIHELADYAHSRTYDDVFVVKHDYQPRDETKFLNQVQEPYPCKNWSSLMVFNGHRVCVKQLTPEVVNTAEAMWLHQFKWAQSVGSLPCEWNHLVGEYHPNPSAKLVHFTRGGPWFKGYEKCEFADEWFAEFRDMIHRDNPSFKLERLWEERHVPAF